jgi:hypothetical protein
VSHVCKMKAQPSFQSGRLAYTTSLRLSLNLLPVPLFQAFSALRLIGVPSSVVAKLVALVDALGFAVFADLVGGPCCSWLRGGCGFCRTLPNSADGSEAESLFSEPVLGLIICWFLVRIQAGPPAGMTERA